MLCNLYTHDSMKDLVSNHSEFADHGIVWYSDPDLKVVEDIVYKDMVKTDGWFEKWYMKQGRQLEAGFIQRKLVSRVWKLK